MTKIDLITGFLGSGKTTLLKKYAKHLIEKGEKVAILEFDYGAVNVDMMLLQELNDSCDLEMVAGGCDYDCHIRRFKTKLISMGMRKYDRVIVEPSGLFDPDEFFDVLNEEPLNDWYEIGSIIAVVDPSVIDGSESSSYLFASQIAACGAIFISKRDLHSEEEITSFIGKMRETCLKFGVLTSRTRILDDSDPDYLEELSSCSYFEQPHQKLDVIKKNDFSSLYFLEEGLTLEQIKAVKNALFDNDCYGGVKRIKGFIFEGDEWLEYNATKDNESVSKIGVGQDVIIVIGEKLDEKRIKSLFSEAKK